MKSASELHDEAMRQRKSAAEQQYAAALRAQTMASIAPIDLLGKYPVTCLIVYCAVVIAVIAGMEKDRTARVEANEARDRANLECRLTGGTYEYFGTQGYVCIPPHKQDSGSVK